MKASPIIANFNAGEFSPLMAGRVELKAYQNACRRIRNFIPTIQGPARRRAGTRFVAEVKNSANRVWLGRFEFNNSQAYIIEFSNNVFRFFSLHGVVGAPFELAVPYSTADYTDANGLFTIRFAQSGDTLYLAHRSYPTQKLVRTGASTFTIAATAFTWGPFKDVDPTNTVTVYASANIGAGITLTASSAIFTAAHVGTNFYMEQKNVDDIKQWETGKVMAINDVRRSDGKNYHALNAATTGAVRPIHSAGAKYDGNAGVQWQFDDPGYGYATITAIGGGGTTATATVVKRIPDGAVLVGNATTRWAFSAWSSVEGYPDNVTFFRERLCFARDRLVWGSASGDFENFADRDDGGVVTADSAFSSDITSDRANTITWFAPSDKALIIGTAADEHAMYENASTDPFGPGNIANRKQSEYGARRVRNVKVGEGVIYVQNSGRKMMDVKMAESINERWASSDLTVLSEHITKGGIIDMAYQQETDSVVWTVLSGGQLVGFTLNREQEVKGWHSHRIGGYSNSAKTKFAVVESIATIPSPAGDRDELWMVVNRYINGATKRYIEYMEYFHEEGDDPDESFYVDCGLSLHNTRNFTLTPGNGATVKGTAGVLFDSSAGACFVAGDVGKFIHYTYYLTDVKGKKIWYRASAEITQFNSTTEVVATIRLPWPDLTTIAANGWRVTVTTISGLSHLEGQTVSILADGAAHPDRVVSGGSITLDNPASVVHVGLACPAVLQPMPLETGAADGTAQGKTKRSSRVAIRFHDTLGAKYGRDEDKQLDQILTRAPGDSMDAAPPLFTGDKLVSWPDGYDGEALITIVQPQPLPCTVVAIMPQTTTQDAR